MGQPTERSVATVQSAKTSDYTLDGSSEVVPVDISSGSVNVDELALGSMSANAIVEVQVTADAGTGSSNKVQIRNSAATVIAVLFRKGQKWKAAYDGTNRRVLDNTSYARAHVRKTADQIIAASAEETFLNSNVSEIENDGNLFNSANGAFEPPSDGDWILRIEKIKYHDAPRTEMYGEHSVNGDWSDVPNIGSGVKVGDRGDTGPETHLITSGQTVTMKVYNTWSGGSETIWGDANNDESGVVFTLTPDLRA